MFLSSKPVEMFPDADDQNLLSSALYQLIEGDFQTRWEAAKQLTNLGPQTVAHLIPLIEDAELDWEIRWFAARALGEFDDAAALNALVQLLEHTQEPELIVIAAEGLSHFGDRGVAALMRLAEAPSHRLTAVQALASIRHDAVFEPLLTAAQDPDAGVRATAIAALSTFYNPQVDTLYLAAIKDIDATVRKEAITNLGLRSYLLKQMDLDKILLPGLWDVYPAVNKATAIALGRLGTPTAIANLVRVLTSPHTPEVLQIDCVMALGWIEQEAALQALMTAWPTVSPTVQVEIVAALTHWRTPLLKDLSATVLCDWLTAAIAAPTEMPALKQAIALALSTLEHLPARPILQLLAEDANEQTCLYAEAALRHLSKQSTGS